MKPSCMGLGAGTTLQFVVGGILLLSGLAYAEGYCTPPAKNPPPPGSSTIGRVVSAEGAELRHPFGVTRRNANPEDCLYLGTTLVTNGQGRLALELALDPNDRSTQQAPVMNLGPNSRLTLKEQRRERSKADWVLELLDGWFQFFSGREVELDVDTPYITAGVKGTEFALYTDDEYCKVDEKYVGKGCSALFVQEGRVKASLSYLTEQDDNKIRDSLIEVVAGDVNRDTVIAVDGDRPRYASLTITPEDAVNWVLYYPPLVRFDPAACPDTETSRTLVDDTPVRCLQDQRFDNKVARLEKQGVAANDAELSEAAVRLLHEGQIERARRLLGEAVGPEALALQSLIALNSNDKEGALELAKKATRTKKDSAHAYLALSYALQADFNLDEAVEATKDAAKHAQNEPLILARQAELELAQQDVAAAIELAEQAIEMARHANPDNRCESDLTNWETEPGDPVLSRAYAVQGYAELVNLDAEQAKKSFEKARCAGSLSPLVYLGLGLADIRQGRLDEGVRQLEIAVALDPKVSLYRSYLGKGYYEQNRLQSAAKQLQLAKGLDVQDPTPWLYEAFIARDRNDPVGALSAMETSRYLNENRAVYRSQLLIDSDDAVRSTGLGRIYERLGFEELARLEATKSLAVDPGNYSANRLLTDAKTRQQRQEITRVSNLLQARVRSPKVQHPVGAQVASTRLQNSLGSSVLTPAINEYSKLFDRDGMKLTAEALIGEQDTLKGELRFSAVEGPWSAAITQYHFETDGYRPKNYRNEDYWNLIGQLRVLPSTSIQIEYRNLDFDHGDLNWFFDPTDFFLSDANELIESTRASIHHVFSPTLDNVTLVRKESADATVTDTGTPGSPFFQQIGSESGTQGETQFVKKLPSIDANVVAGVGHYDQDRTDTLVFLNAFRRIADQDTRYTNYYGYLTQNFYGPEGNDSYRGSVTIGGSYEDLSIDIDGTVLNPIGGLVFANQSSLDIDKLFPKLGLSWTFPDVEGVSPTVRAAYFESVKRPFLANETLEPTTIAGFDQFYDDVNGTQTATKSLGVDLGMADKLFGGIEWVRRDLDIPAISFSTFAIETGSIKEETARLYLNYVPTPRWSIATSFQRQKHRRSAAFRGPEGIVDSDTNTWTSTIRYFSPKGHTFAVSPIWLDQDGEFVQSAPPNATYRGSDSAFILNLSASYRLPGVDGEITLGVDNVFDEEYRFQDEVPYDSRFAPERSVSFLVSVAL